MGIRWAGVVLSFKNSLAYAKSSKVKQKRHFQSTECMRAEKARHIVPLRVVIHDAAWSPLLSNEKSLCVPSWNRSYSSECNSNIYLCASETLNSWAWIIVWPNGSFAILIFGGVISMLVPFLTPQLLSKWHVRVMQPRGMPISDHSNAASSLCNNALQATCIRFRPVENIGSMQWMTEMPRSPQSHYHWQIKQWICSIQCSCKAHVIKAGSLS